MKTNFLANLKEKKLILSNEKVLVAVSGGIDSTVLLYLLAEVRKEDSFSLALAHVNYQARPTADRDEAFVKELAQNFGLNLFLKKAVLPKSNQEEAARKIRYDFFEETLEKEEFDKVAVAHNKNDWAETILLNLTRGTGLDGLTSMQERNKRFIRPLLTFSRSEIQAYARKEKIEFQFDETNDSLKYSRNRIRSKVVPQLEKINPSFINTTASGSILFDELNDFISKTVKIEFAKVKNDDGSLNRQKISQLHPYLQKELLKTFIKETVGSSRDFTQANFEDALDLVSTGHGSKEISLPHQLRLVRVYDKIHLEKVGADQPKKGEVVNLDFHKETRFGDWSFFLNEANKQKREEDLVLIDIQKAGPLLLRSRKEADKVSFGEGSKKIKKIFIDEKIPKHERDQYPIVVNEKDEVVWIPNIRLNTKFKATEKSTQVATIKAIRSQKIEKT